MKRLIWCSPVTHYLEAELGKVKIRKHQQSTRSAYYCEGVRGELFIQYSPKGNVITQLEISGKGWMTDEPQYVWCLQSFADRSSGNVLVAGLGLGIVVLQLLSNEAVKKITVLEIEPDVMQLISPHFENHPRGRVLEIREDDFYDFMEHDKEQRDVVIWDLAVWGLNDDKLGLADMLRMPALVRDKYGPACQLFRHGFDRDPVGQKFVKENQELMYRMKELLRWQR